MLSTLLSCVAVAVFLPLGTWALSIMKIQSAALTHEIVEAMPLLIAAIPFGIAQSLVVGALEGRREFLKINIGLTCGTVATAVLPLIAALTISFELPTLLAAALVARTLSLTLLVVGCARAVPVRRPERASAEEAWGLIRFGGWTTISNIVGPILVFVDRFAIGAVLSTAAVALYVVPFNLVSQLSVLPAALASALFPRLAMASAKEASILIRDAVRILLFIVTPASLAMLAGAGAFLQLWVGVSTSRESIPVAYALIFGFWANSLARIPAARLVAEGRPDLLAKVHLAEIIPYLALLYYGMLKFGILGAALAWSVRCFADALILYGLAKTERRAKNLLLIHSCIVLMGAVVALLLPRGGLETWAIMAVLFMLTAILLAHSTPPQLMAVLRRLRPDLVSRIDGAP